MENVYPIEAYVGAAVIATIILWMIGSRLLKTYVSLHKTDNPDFCGCGSHAPNLGSKSHYTAAEFAERDRRKYERSNAKVVENAIVRSQQRYLESQSPKEKSKFERLLARWHSIMDAHAEKCDRKWFACLACGHVTRRHYVPIEHQERFGVTSEKNLYLDRDLAGSLVSRAYLQKAQALKDAMRGEE
jgi:hypothetical protein